MLFWKPPSSRLNRSPRRVHPPGAVRAELAGRGGVFGRPAGLLNRQGAVLLAKEPRPDAAAAANRDERGQVAFGLAVVPGDLGAEVRLLDERVDRQAGHHHAGAAHVVAFGALHRADDRRVLHLSADLRQQAIDLDARDGRGGRLGLAHVRVRVFVFPEVDGRVPAAEVDDDQALVLLLQNRRLGPKGTQEVVGGQGEGPERGSVLDEVPAISNAPHGRPLTWVV